MPYIKNDMHSIHIRQIDQRTMREARKLVERVSPRQNPIERLSFIAIRPRHSRFMRSIVRLMGVAGVYNFWVAVDENTGSRYLRLYTSDGHREKAAQILYESRGLRVVKEKKRLFHTVIYRELSLKNRGNPT